MKRCCLLLRPKKVLPTKQGFTILESSLVICLMIALCSYGATLLFLSQEHRVRGDLEHVYTILVYLQRKAVTEHRVCYLVFDSTKNTFSGTIEGTLSSGVCFGRLKETTRQGTLGAIDTRAITWRNATVYAYPDGIISSGALYLTDTKRTIQYALTVDASAIRAIRRYTYNGSWRCIDLE